MRRSLAILLALVFSWMLVLPAFVPADANLPACCRKNGKHHCMMGMDPPADTAQSIAAIRTNCPSFPQVTAVPHTDIFGVNTGQAVFAGLVSHHSALTQTEAGFRISYHRSRQKRGPPFSILS